MYKGVQCLDKVLAERGYLPPSSVSCYSCRDSTPLCAKPHLIPDADAAINRIEAMHDIDIILAKQRGDWHYYDRPGRNGEATETKKHSKQKLPAERVRRQVFGLPVIHFSEIEAAREEQRRTQYSHLRGDSQIEDAVDETCDSRVILSR